MFKYYFEQIHNVEVWPIISLSIFMIFFLGLLLWVFKVDKSYIDEMKNLPLDDKNETIIKATKQ
jgi:cytochrome c oxidase cbb3-type subunit 4